MHKKLARAFRHWVPIAVVITALIGFTHVAVQQNYRQGANDPQIQMAEDSANSLNSGARPQDLFGPNKIDLSQSLSPFLIIFDQHGGVIASNAILNNSIPTPPAGVFDYVKNGNENRLTWQPDLNVRIAAVIAKYNDGYVLAGRSLREVEIREDNLTKMTLLAWITTLGASFVAAFLFI